jgi:uncharacterized protein (DUF1697 family)
MAQRYVALLRAIAHVPMLPLRDSLAELGLSDVESHGMSGNLMFSVSAGSAAELETRIGKRLKTAAIIRTASQLAKVMKANPFASRTGASIYFLARVPSAAKRQEFAALDFEEPAPVLSGKTVFIVHPTRLKGRKGIFDFEKFLGVPATVRTARIVERILALMSETAKASRRPARRK